MNALSTINTLRSQLLLALLCLCVFPILASCSAENEPDEMTNGYYVTVETKEYIYRRGGLPPEPKNDMIGKLTQQMMSTITEITNVHRRQGELVVHDAAVQRGRDAEVIIACDSIYRFYLESELKSVTVCTVGLYRARMQNGIIRGSHKLKTYHF